MINNLYVDVAAMTRDQLIEELMWNSGGTGFGIPNLANAMRWREDRPSEKNPDFPSIVLVNEPKERYSDDDLRALVAFSRRQTSHHDKYYRWRRGTSLIIIGAPKEPGEPWFRTRMHWTIGVFYSPTLKEALDVFDRRLDSEFKP